MTRYHGNAEPFFSDTPPDEPTPRKADRRIHLLETDAPLQWPTSLDVRCGIRLEHARPVWMFRDDFKPSELWLEGFTSLQVCRRCLDDPPNTADEKRDYLYGLVDGVAVRLENDDRVISGI